MPTSNFSTISTDDLSLITGGAGAKLDFDAIRAKAAPYCPQTVERYSNLNPASVTRSKAVKMGNDCVAEMGPGWGRLARPRIDAAIDEAFPRK